MRFLAVAFAAALIAAPGATTGPAQDITQTQATLTGTVDPNGVDTVYSFEYGTTTAYGLQTGEVAAGAGDGDVDAAIPVTGLTSDTLYHYRLVATNADGTVRGADRTFRTAAPPANPPPPTVSTGAARAITADGATLNGSVRPRGSATTAWFEYGLTRNYGTATARQAIGSGTAAVPVSATIAGLRPFTRYHYRLVAVNAAGTTRGRNRSFVTARAPTGVTIALEPRRVPWSARLTVTGRVTGGGVGGVRVALESSAFPFTAAFAQVGQPVSAASNGSFRFVVPSLLTSTRFRAATRTAQPVASAAVTARSVARVGARVRRRGRARVRVEGTVAPAIPSGRVSLQRRSRSGRWVLVRRGSPRPLDATRSRYRFTVRRARRARVYRVVASPLDGGAHVRGVSRELRVGRRR
jgi:hypothetical protein